MPTLRSTAGTWTCGTNPVKCTRLPNRCARRCSAGRSGRRRRPAAGRPRAAARTPPAACRHLSAAPAAPGRRPAAGAGRETDPPRPRRTGPGRSRAGSRAHGRPVSRRRAAAGRPTGSARSPRPCRAAATAPPRLRPPAARRRAGWPGAAHAARSDARWPPPAAVAQRREPGQRQHGHILAAMHMDQIHPPGAQHMPHRQRRPALPQHRYPQAGPDHLAVSPEPDRVRGPGQPRCHHQLAQDAAMVSPLRLRRCRVPRQVRRRDRCRGRPPGGCPHPARGSREGSCGPSRGAATGLRRPTASTVPAGTRQPLAYHQGSGAGTGGYRAGARPVDAARHSRGENPQRQDGPRAWADM